MQCSWVRFVFVCASALCFCLEVWDSELGVISRAWTPFHGAWRWDREEEEEVLAKEMLVLLVVK